MEISSKKLERTSKIVYFIISMVLCLFLILLTNNIMEDIDTFTDRPTESSFENTQRLPIIRDEIQTIDDSLRVLNNRIEQIDKALGVATQSYTNEKLSFDNWLEARKTIGSPSNDKEVLERAEALDNYFKIQEAWNAQKASFNDLAQKYNDERSKKVEQSSVIEAESYRQFEDALAAFETKVFLLRLLLVAPLLGLGVWFVVRLRKHKFWPLFQGFSLFSVYVFFVGLVPYLPSYGGYIRYSVGVVMSLFIGYYVIKRLRTYMDKKKKELETSSKERAMNVELVTAERALMNHVCPSCGKDFILRNWEHQAEGLKNATLITDYCRFCGLELFSSCNNCGTMNFVHLPYCSHCGTKNKEK